jgi:hypothetical protein
MRGRIASLNAAVAGSILVFEAAMQRAAPEATPTPGAGVPSGPTDLADRPMETPAESRGNDEEMPG